MGRVSKALVVAWLVIYLAFGVWGCTLLREGLEPINLLVRDSYAIPHYHNLEKYFWSYGMQVSSLPSLLLSSPHRHLDRFKSS